MIASAAGILAALPQTQCTRCGYPDCAAYAQALHDGSTDINQCPPGGFEGVQRLAALTGLLPKPLNPDNGLEGPRTVVFIDEAWCIGCTLCIKACPVDAIVGANKLMHTVIESYCTGCALCLPVCPVDCIEIETVSGSATGWAAWSQEQAGEARQRYEFHTLKSEREALENAQRLEAKAELKLSDLATHSQHTDPGVLEKKRAVIEAALARARAKREAAP
ncbi:MAG: electron transport complex subunit RsxB [Polaromonas sp.]|nr:electron transport complex subunit RsxB [Polaromonas sp.]